MMMGYCAPIVFSALKVKAENRVPFAVIKDIENGFKPKIYGGVIVYLWSQLQW